MLADTNDRPCADEAYIVATSTSDLTLNPDRVCSATHLIAAGLLGNRMGAALVHLRSEWDTASKPRKATEDEIRARAQTLAADVAKEKKLPKGSVKPDVRRARTEALVGYAVAMRHRAHRCAGWLPAVSIMGEWAQLRGVDLDLLSPALYHWLSPVCPVCDGLGHRKMDDAPVLGKQCHHCEGRGEWPKPMGADRVHDWLRGCIGKAKAERGGLMHGRIDAEDLRERSASKQKPMPDDESDAAATAAYFRDGLTKPQKRRGRDSMGLTRPKG